MVRKIESGGKQQNDTWRQSMLEKDEKASTHDPYIRNSSVFSSDLQPRQDKWARHKISRMMSLYFQSCMSLPKAESWTFLPVWKQPLSTVTVWQRNFRTGPKSDSLSCFVPVLKAIPVVPEVASTVLELLAPVTLLELMMRRTTLVILMMWLRSERLGWRPWSIPKQTGVTIWHSHNSCWSCDWCRATKFIWRRRSGWNACP